MIQTTCEGEGSSPGVVLSTWYGLGTGSGDSLHCRSGVVRVSACRGRVRSIWFVSRASSYYYNVCSSIFSPTFAFQFSHFVSHVS